MEWTQMVFVGLLLLLINSVWGESANLGDSVILTSNKTCTDREEFKLIHRLRDDSPRTVATRVRGVWMPEKGYKNRTEHHSTLSVVLTRVNINDNGLYEFMCGGSDVHRIQLEVVLPSDISVAEGGTAPLPCHAFTTSEPVKLISWERNGKRVLELDHFSGEIRYGSGFEGRASVSSDWYPRGDLTLTLERAQLEDDGVYICYIEDKEGTRTRGKPAAVRMRVNKRIPDQITCKPPPVSQTQQTEGTWIILGIIAVVVVGLLPAAFGCGWWLKSRASNVRPEPDVEEPVRDAAIELLPVREPADEVNEEPSRLANGF